MSEADRLASRNLRAVGIDSALSTRNEGVAAGLVAPEHEGRADGPTQQVGQLPHLTREERFTQLFRAHARRVARVITAAVRPEDRANVVDDLGQETFLRVWVSLDTLDRCDEQAAGRYIAAIARNRVRSHYRDLARHRTREAPAAHDALVWGSAAAAASDDVAAQVAEFDEHLAVITALNDGLPDEVADVLRLRFVEDQSITDVAERIGRSRATTVRRQAEGLALLRERLAEHRSTADDGADVGRCDAALDRARRAVARAEQQRTVAAERAADRAQLAPVRPDVTLRDYGATRLRPAMRGLAKGKPAEHYRAGWRQRVVPALGDRPVREIDARTVQEAARSWAASDLSRHTVFATRSVLARVLDEAVADGLLAHNPARDRNAGADDETNTRPRERTELGTGADFSAPEQRSVTTTTGRSAREDDRRAGQVDHPAAPQPVTGSARVATRHDDPDDHDDAACAGDEDLGGLDETTTSSQPELTAQTPPAPELTPARPAAAASAAEPEERDSLAGARWAVARVGQLRAAAERERRAEERARAEQLARWHDDDRAAEDGDGRDRDSRDLEEAAAAASDADGSGGRW